MIRTIFIIFIFLTNLSAFEKDIKSVDFNLALTKYVLSSSINKNLDIKSVDKWYLNTTNNELYLEIKENEEILNKELLKSYVNFQKEIISISDELKSNSFYFEKLFRFTNLKKEFLINELVQANLYFIVDSGLKNSFVSVGRFYIKSIDLDKEAISLSKKTDVFYARYYFNIKDIRLNNLKSGFKDDVTSLNLDIDIFISIKDIKFFDLNKEEIK